MASSQQPFGKYRLYVNFVMLHDICQMSYHICFQKKSETNCKHFSKLNFNILKLYFVCISVCLHVCARCSWRPQDRHQIPWNWELQTVVSCHVGARNQVLRKWSLFITEPSLQPLKLNFRMNSHFFYGAMQSNTLHQQEGALIFIANPSQTMSTQTGSPCERPGDTKGLNILLKLLVQLICWIKGISSRHHAISSHKKTLEKDWI